MVQDPDRILSREGSRQEGQDSWPGDGKSESKSIPRFMYTSGHSTTATTAGDSLILVDREGRRPSSPSPSLLVGLMLSPPLDTARVQA